MKKILFLVDNDRTVKMFYQEKLSLFGLEIMISNKSEGIFETIDYHKPDIIFADKKRWEGLSVHPALEYEMESVSSGYVIGRAAGCRKLNVKVKTANEGGNDPLELILLKSHEPGRSSNLTSDAENALLQSGLPALMEIQHQECEMTLPH